MIGESLLIAPVYEQNARGRYVYLPGRDAAGAGKVQ